jgi:predicted phage tail protein
MAIVIDALCEGPIVGLVNGAQSVFFDKTPLQNADGSFNFNNAVFEYTSGDLASNYSAMSQMTGDSSDVESTTEVGVQVWQATPIVRNVTTPNIDSLRVTVSVPSLTYQDPNTGDISGSSVEFTIAIQSNEGGFVTVVNDTISGKTTSQYSRSYLIPLSGTGPFDVQVTRVSADSGETYLQNALWFDSFTSIISTHLEYRHTALAGISIDAQQFSSIPTRAYDVKGLVINVPSNYDPIALTYNGTWDGTFQLAWSNNPAWCFYDLLINTRYGLGDLIEPDSINKWQLYAIAQYCDQLVPDGFGGQEPRFSCNLYIQSDEDAFKVIQNLASIFRAAVFWSAGTVAVMQDAPSDPIQMFTSANVLAGTFKYQGTSLKSRHTVALVTWNDPSDWCSQKVEYVQNDAAVAKYGVIKAQVTAFGCTSRGQAHRVGQWLLYSEQLETETISFRCGMDGVYIYPGAVIQTSDPNRAGKRMGGRVLEISQDLLILTVDAAFEITQGMSMSVQVAMPDGTILTQAINSVNSQVVDNALCNTIILAAPLTTSPNFVPLPNAIYLITETDIQPELWRVVTITQVDNNQIEVSAVSQNPSKYASIEDGLTLNVAPTSNLSAVPAPPSNLSVLVSRYVIDIGVAGLSLMLSWTGSAARYVVTYQQANGQQVTLTQDQQSLDIENVSQGASYTFTVTAVSTLGFSSQVVSYTTTINAPPMVYPADVASLSAQITGGGVLLSWNDIEDPMLYDYEIREGSSWSNSISLGFFAGTNATVPPLPSNNYQWMIKARDKLLNESVDATTATLLVSAPLAPLVQASLVGQNYVLSWTTPLSMFPIDHYVISTETSASSSGTATVYPLQLALAYTTQYQSKANFVGSQSFWVTAVDVAGNASPQALVQITINAPSQPVVTTQVIDNNVLLYWSDSTQSLPVLTYQISKGATALTATVIGTKSGLFTTVFETVAGTYTYWIEGIDSAGNVGTAGSITACVNAPPDYVLHSDIFSNFEGILTNAVLADGVIALPVDTTSTWAEHFIENNWNSPNDQINAGYPIYGEPTLVNGSYEEIIDYGATLAATNVTVTPTTQVIAGNPSTSITISCSNTSGSGPWTDYPNTSQVYLTNFRWIKVCLTVNSEDNVSLIEVSSLEIKLDVKLKNDAGTALAVASDTGGTNVSFNVAFVDVTSINVTPQGSTPVTALYEFIASAYPTNFQIFLFDANGNRVAGTVSWSAKGY